MTESIIRIKLWDKDSISDDFMGQVVLDLNKLPSGKKEDWFPVEETKGHFARASGQLFLKLNFVSTENFVCFSIFF